MVKHIVLYTFRERVEKEKKVKRIASMLEPLVGQIPGLLHMEIRPTAGEMDYALYSAFESWDALKGYRDHPLHLAAKEQFFHLLASRVSADYEL